MIATFVAIVVLAAWGIVFGWFAYDTAVVVSGKSARRPTVIEVLSAWEWWIVWSIPSAIFLAIWGGVFWW